MRPQLVAASACGGLALASVARIGPLTVGAVCALVFAVAPRVVVVAAVAALLGWLWGSVRLDSLDASALAPLVGEARRASVVVTGPARTGRFSMRIPATVTRFAGRPVHEPTLLDLAKGRAPPPQGAVLSGLVVVKAPRAPADGFDERTWLRRRGVHVLLHVDAWHVIGRRGGIGGVADTVRRGLRRSITSGLGGERAAVVAGVVLGDEQGISQQLRDRFRAAGLYHLLAVSGQNVALVTAGVIVSAWVLGVSRLIAELVALAAIAAYVLAVGAQPSVVRAGVAGGLCSLAWLTARAADRWHVLLVGAAVLLAWNPYTLFDVGFQLSFAAVIAIFVLVPRFQDFLEGYPLGPLRPVVAVSAACGLATAPILWLQFHSLQVLAIPANALAAPAIVPLLGLAFAATAVAPISGGAAAALTWLNGWCAAYLAGVARLVGGLPFAQIQSTRTLLTLLAGALLIAAYALPKWPRARSSPSI
ncbi:MAG: ComEC/Rec2 family competence protein [Gaiellaceae bacterium]